MVFAIPRGNITYIGTTDTTYNKDIDQPQANREDVAYILRSINYMFPAAKINISDIESTWAGLRPLIHQEGKSPSELSRRDEIFYSETGLISIAGGKLTGYRKMAERVLNFVFKTMHKKSSSITQNLPVSGGDFDSQEAIQEFLYRSFGESRQLEIMRVDIQKLFSKYGRNISLIIDKAYSLKPTVKDPQSCLLHAEVWYSIHYEMSMDLCDFLIRRTGRLYFERPALAAIYPEVATIMASILGWTDAQKTAALQAFEQQYHDVLSFQKK
jgi:glycerol-3-phosphate dehydrogenase